jgi:putative N-acetyltransferase (TIGR04045 family)
MSTCLEALVVGAPDPADDFRPCAFRIAWAATDWQRRQAMALRRAVFCIEQGLFVGDDRDAVDDHAQLLVAEACIAGMPDEVVGTVRIHQAPQPGTWWGGRLAVHAAFRQHGRIGATLIRLAVCSAHARGATRFLAHVQAQNVPLFEKLHWHRLGSEKLHGRPHERMEADLAHYPPCADPWAGFVTCASRALPAAV